MFAWARYQRGSLEENSGGYFAECSFPLGPAIYYISSNCAQQVLDWPLRFLSVYVCVCYVVSGIRSLSLQRRKVQHKK